MEELKYYESSEGPSYKVKSLTDLKIGSLLVARYKKGAFHRVVVKELELMDLIFRFSGFLYTPEKYRSGEKSLYH